MLWIRYGVPVICSLFMAFVLGCKVEVAGHRFKWDVESRRLSNGLRVLLIEDPQFPVVSYQTWVRAGSVDEYPGLTGVAHLFEHLMFRGTEKNPGRTFSQFLESRGARVNAYTNRDYTVFYENFSPEFTQDVIRLEADRLLSLRLTDEVIEREKRIVLQERAFQLDGNIKKQAELALWELAFDSHPYRWSVMGYPRDVYQLKPELARSFYKRFYQPSNTTVVVVGSFDADQVSRWIEKYYGPLPGRRRPTRPKGRISLGDAERRQTLKGTALNDQVTIAYRISEAGHPDSYALDLLSHILFEGDRSRLYQAMVNRQRVATNVSGSSYTPLYPGLFSIQVEMAGKHRPIEAEREVYRELNQIEKQGVSSGELKEALLALKIDFLNQVRSAHGLAQLLGIVQTVHDDFRVFAKDWGKYQNVRSKDLKRVISRYLIPNNRIVVTVESQSKGTS